MSWGIEVDTVIANISYICIMNNENQNTEYKRIWKDEYLKWVCGFANAQGGKIYIGIDDDMSVHGVTHIHQQLEDIPNKIVTMLGIVPSVSHIERDGKDIIEIDIEHSNIPISYKGAFYMRSGATNQELRGLALQQFLMKKFGRSWEDMPCYGATIDDIDPEAIRYFLKKGIKEKRMSPDAENSTPEEVISNLGLMDGNLIQMAERVMRVLDEKYLIRPIHYEGLQRVEPLELPEDALREIICNSIVHRDHQGTWTQMSVYSDHIRLWNEGKLPDDLSVEKLMGKHTSQPRNPKMAEAFYRAGFIEAWGRGIEKIVNGFKADGLTPPTFSVEQGGVTVHIPREKFVAINLGGTTDINQFKDPENTDIKSDQEPNQTEPKPNQNRTKTEQKNRIVELITANPTITRAELSKELGLHESSIQRRLDALVKEGRIRHIGPTNGGTWEVLEPN